MSIILTENIASSLSLSTPIINRLSSSFASLNNHSHARAGSVVSAISEFANFVQIEIFQLKFAESSSNYFLIYILFEI